LTKLQQADLAAVASSAVSPSNEDVRIGAGDAATGADGEVIGVAPPPSLELAPSSLGLAPSSLAPPLLAPPLLVR